MFCKWLQILNDLSKHINELYGYVQVDGDNFGEPAINSGPCAPFANAFFHCWNNKFEKKVIIVFVMVKNSDECWHTLIQLPNGMLFDGGIGVHEPKNYDGRFTLEYMISYDWNLLDERAYGLDRQYPRYCPPFSLPHVTSLINEFLERINPNELADST